MLWASQVHYFVKISPARMLNTGNSEWSSFTLNLIRQSVGSICCDRQLVAGITVRNPALIPDKGILLVSKGILLEIKGILLLSRGILTIRRFVPLDPPFRDPRNAVSLLSVRCCVFLRFFALTPHLSLKVPRMPINTKLARSERCLWPLTHPSLTSHYTSPSDGKF